MSEPADVTEFNVRFYTKRSDDQVHFFEDWDMIVRYIQMFEKHSIKR